MPHHAYLKYVTEEKRYWRYILTAPDARTIDEWWRVASSKDKNNVVRLTPDFYTWSSSGSAWDLAPELADKVIITGLSNQDQQSPVAFHQPERADVVSGNSFYIRSKSNPSLYWLAKGDQILATTQGRTRFIFRIVGDRDNKNRDNRKSVIIGSDEISIIPIGGESRQKYVSVNDNSELVLSGHNHRMYYSDLKWNFLAQGEFLALGETGSLGSALITMVEGYGEEWELVQ